MTLIFVRLKRLIASVLQSRAIGAAINWLCGEIIPFHGVSIDVAGAGIPVANKAALWWGMYESAEYRLITRFLRPDLPVIELGSSIGAISSVISQHLDRGQRLTCVEANPSLIPVLKRNLHRNADHLVVKIVHAAVSYDSDVVRFAVSSNNLTSSIPIGCPAETQDVNGVRLSALVGGDAGPAFQMVADIEGAEVALYLQDAKSLDQCQVMVVELHSTVWRGKPYTPSDLEHLIESLGFHVVARDGAVVACYRRSRSVANPD
jgi:FkbM family methyltransferase